MDTHLDWDMCPADPQQQTGRDVTRAMIAIGIDAHKRTHTAVIVDDHDLNSRATPKAKSRRRA